MRTEFTESTEPGMSPSREPGDLVNYSVSPAGQISDWLLWQLADSAFPTGGFAHSAGLEAAWQHGEIRHRDELGSFLEASLHQLSRAALPFVSAAWEAPDRLPDFDKLCEVFTTNHVANRASRLQGKALLNAVERIFKTQADRSLLTSTPTGEQSSPPPFAHYAPVFGTCLRRLNVMRETTVRLFFFNHLRSIVAAAVRMNIIGPMEAQSLQHRLAPTVEKILQRGLSRRLDDLAQTAPLLDLWQGNQDRLYSRLFQS